MAARKLGHFHQRQMRRDELIDPTVKSRGVRALNEEHGSPKALQPSDVIRLIRYGRQTA